MSLFQKTAAVLTAGLMVLTAVVGSASVPDVSVHVSAASQGTYNDINYKNYGSYVEIVSYNGSPSAVTIPETIDGVKVTTIGDFAFASCSLSSVRRGAPSPVIRYLI